MNLNTILRISAKFMEFHWISVNSRRIPQISAEFSEFTETQQKSINFSEILQNSKNSAKIKDCFSNFSEFSMKFRKNQRNSAKWRSVRPECSEECTDGCSDLNTGLNTEHWTLVFWTLNSVQSQPWVFCKQYLQTNVHEHAGGARSQPWCTAPSAGAAPRLRPEQQQRPGWAKQT